ncbi:MAG: hypothetical protein WDN29_02125 [Methylovirgula sp.]
MKYAIYAGVLVLPFYLAGCADLDETLNKAVSWIDAPATQHAIESLKTGVNGVHMRRRRCRRGSTADRDGRGWRSVDHRTDGKVYVGSSTVCAALGGTLGPQAVIP